MPETRDARTNSAADANSHAQVLTELAIRSLLASAAGNHRLPPDLLGRAARERITNGELLRERLLVRAGAPSNDPAEHD